MGVSGKLTSEIKGIAVLTIIIVVMSIVLVKFKDVSGAVCPTAYPTYNASTDNCLNSTFASTSLNNVGNSINSSVTALQEPVTWIAIIVIIIVVAWLMSYLKGKKSGM